MGNQASPRIAETNKIRRGTLWWFVIAIALALFTVAIIILKEPTESTASKANDIGDRAVVEASSFNGVVTGVGEHTIGSTETSVTSDTVDDTVESESGTKIVTHDGYTGHSEKSFAAEVNGESAKADMPQCKESDEATPIVSISEESYKKLLAGQKECKVPKTKATAKKLPKVGTPTAKVVSPPLKNNVRLVEQRKQVPPAGLVGVDKVEVRSSPVTRVKRSTTTEKKDEPKELLVSLGNPFSGRAADTKNQCEDTTEPGRSNIAKKQNDPFAQWMVNNRMVSGILPN